MADDYWFTMESAPKNGTVIECLWPGYNNDERIHQGRCIYKRDWYKLGKPVILECWWTGSEFMNPTAKNPIYWRPL